jgi:hypothetical protein
VSVARAKQAYGVAIAPDGTGVDTEATAVLRKSAETETPGPSQ